MTHIPSPFAWSLDPGAIIFLIVLLAAYLIATGPLRPRYQTEPVRRKDITAFIAGWALLALSVLSPLDTLGRYYLFSAHTLQLFIIITAVAPLLMMGLPDTLSRRLLPTRRLREVGRDPLFSVIAVVLFNMFVLVWHAGPIYTAAMFSSGWHDLQLLTFLLAGVLTWWPLLTPADTHVRMSSPLQILYLSLESLPLDVFGVFTIFAAGLLYPAYLPGLHALGFSPQLDQQIGGGILAVPGNIVDLVLMSLVFFGWINQMERAQRERERKLYDEQDGVSALPTIVDGEATAQPKVE